MTHDEYIEKVSALNPNLEIMSNYTGSSNPITCKCLTCGHVWTKTRATSVLRKTKGNGCPECYRRKQSKTHEQFVTEINNSMPNIEILSKYKGDEELVKCRCARCGRVWETSAHNLVSAAKRKTGNGCIKCNAEELSQRLCKTHEQFATEIKNSIPDIELLSEYTGDDNLIKCRCTRCGRIWETSAHNLARAAKRRTGNGCIKCKAEDLSQRFRMSEDEVITELKSLRPDIDIISHYVGDKRPLNCKCKNCGYIWNTTRRDLILGRNCPNCYGHSGTSYVEQVICLAFETVLNKDAIKHRYKALIGKELDIFIPSLNIAVEPGSWYFHRIRVDNDREKRLLCKEKGVRLFIIYDNYNLDEPPFDTDCIITEKDLSRVENADYLKLIVMEIMDSVGLDYSTFLESFDDIKVQAKDRSKRRGTKRFKDELVKINPNIEVLGEYTRRHEPIKCRCKVCGCEWEPSAHAVLNGTGCPNCGGTRHKTHDEFISQMKEINPTIEICGQYINGKTHIDCRCTVCGCEWSPIPSSLLRGMGCPKCGKKKSCISRSLSQDNVVERLHSVNPNYELTGSYVNSSTPIECKCKVCGYKWKFLLSNMSDHSNCPECTKKQRTDELVRELQEKSPNIELVGSYVNTATSIECKCKICGFTWNSMPHNISKGITCSQCKQKRRVIEATEQLRIINPNIELLSSPANISAPVNCRCKVCGYEWTPTMHRLLKGSGCARCAQQKAGQYHVLCHDDLVKRLLEINPDIILIGSYSSRSKHIKCKCAICGHEWNPVAHSLLAGRGCPECGKIKSAKARQKPVICVETGVVFESLEEAEKETGICSRNIGSCCRGVRKRAGKLHWKFVD